MQTIRLGAFAALAPAVASSHGKATETPAARRNVRRERGMGDPRCAGADCGVAVSAKPQAARVHHFSRNVLLCTISCTRARSPYSFSLIFATIASIASRSFAVGGAPVA